MVLIAPSPVDLQKQLDLLSEFCTVEAGSPGGPGEHRHCGVAQGCKQITKELSVVL